MRDEIYIEYSVDYRRANDGWETETILYDQEEAEQLARDIQANNPHEHVRVVFRREETVYLLAPVEGN